MAYLYDNFDVKSAKADLNSCISLCQNEVENDLMASIMNSEVWSSSSRDTLYQALETLVTVKYPKLKEKLNKTMTILNYIEKYKENVEQIKKKESKLKTLKPGEWKTHYNEDGTSYRKYHANDQKEIDRLKAEIKVHKENLSHYKNLIESDISSF